MYVIVTIHLEMRIIRNGGHFTPYFGDVNLGRDNFQYNGRA